LSAALFLSTISYNNNNNNNNNNNSNNPLSSIIATVSQYHTRINVMSFLLDGLKSLAGTAGTVLADTGLKGKLRADMLLIDRDIRARKASFGVELYDFVAPLAATPDFFAADDRMTETIRGPFLAAQREVAALAIKRGKIKEKAAQAEVTKKAAFPTPAETIAEQVLNAGKAMGYAGMDAAIATELGMCDSRIKAEKQEFGIKYFEILVQLEDAEGWLPTVRDIRTMYDQVRRDLEKLEAKKVEKQKELLAVGGSVDDLPATAATMQMQAVPPPPPKVPLQALHVNGGTYGSAAAAAPVDPFANGGPIDLWATQGAARSAASATAPVSAPPVSASMMPAISVEKLAMSAAARVTPGMAGMALSMAAKMPTSSPAGLFSYPDHHSNSNNSNGYAPPRASVPSQTTSYATNSSSFTSIAASQPPIDPFAMSTTTTSTAPPPPPFDPFAMNNTTIQPLSYDPFTGAPTSTTTTKSSAHMAFDNNDPFAGL
jgi:hypothetical protein